MGNSAAKDGDLVPPAPAPDQPKADLAAPVRTKAQADAQKNAPVDPNSDRNQFLAPTSNYETFIGPNPETCKYVKKKKIGSGAFGEAHIVERSSDKKIFVAKIMDLQAMSAKDKRYTQTEVMCLAEAEHFAIIRYVEHAVINEDTMIIVMEYADQGDLYNNIRKHGFTCSERDAGLYFVQLLLALDHIHRHRMIHRDIKSANVFQTSSGLLKLGDFGFSQQYDQTVSENVAGTFLGTPYYLAPEMWKGNRYGKKADMWAAGIVLYEFLTTKRPYAGHNMPSLKSNVLKGEFEDPPGCSTEMCESVRLILTQDPARRPSALQMLRLPLWQHYLALFEKMVRASASITEELRTFILSSVEFSNAGVRDLIAEEVATSPTVHFEGPIFKESDGSWKERYLILSEGTLTMTLAKGKQAAAGSERSKKIPISAIISATPVSQQAAGNRYCFAISTTSSTAIIMATATIEERDMWVAKMLEALEMA